MNRPLLFLLLLLPQMISAQIPITAMHNAMRNGDNLCRLEIPYVWPGESGRERTWQLGTAKKESPESWKEIISTKDSVAVIGDYDISHFHVSNDSLIFMGEQSRRSFRIFDEGRPELIYPFACGDSIQGGYSGYGKDEDLQYIFSGWGYTMADGEGILTDGTDTIHHVTRIHRHDIYTSTYTDTLVLNTEEDRYSWYSAGSRYPVMESISRKVSSHGIETGHEEVSYLFLPGWQTDLPEDEENEVLAAELKKIDEADILHENPASGISASLTGDGSVLVLSFHLGRTADVALYAVDVTGDVLLSEVMRDREPGDWNERFSLNRKPAGGTLMLTVRCAGQTVTVKVMRDDR